jgi:hypothetical protein
VVGGRRVHVVIEPVSRQTGRVTLLPAEGARGGANGSGGASGSASGGATSIEKAATSRKVYLPRGTWHDFGSGDILDGGRELDRAVDLATMPLFVRAGAIIPMGPVKQYTDEPVSGPLTVTIYPGADGSFLMYEDDGKSFAHRKGAWTGIDFGWHDATRRLTIRLAKGSRLLPPTRRPMEIRLATPKSSTAASPSREITFEGRDVIVTF